MSKNKTALAKVAEPQTAELVTLPVSAKKADSALVERAVAQIKDIVSKTLARGMDEVGQYLLREFYEDDPALYHSSSPNKHASLTLLLERCETMDLPVSRTFLSNSLRIAAVTKALPRAAAFRQLPPSHRVELVRVRVPEKLERLATKAVEGRLTVQKLRKLVQREQEKNKDASGRGRKRSPDVLKAVERCLRALRNEETGKLLFSKGDVTSLNEEQRGRADLALKSLEKRVAELRRILT